MEYKIFDLQNYQPSHPHGWLWKDKKKKSFPNYINSEKKNSFLEKKKKIFFF